MGPVELAQSASMILASGLIGALARRFTPPTIVTIGLAGIAVVIAAAGAVDAIWQLLALMFVIGWFVVPLQAAIVTILQSTVADGERGRVMSVLQAVMSATSVLSMALAGLAGDAIGVREVFFAAGAICAVCFVGALIGYRTGETKRSAVTGPGDEPAVPSAPAA
jgi:MFS family permease